MLFEFLDDSGTHDDSRMIVLAGFIGEYTEWEAIDREWKRTLDKKEWPSRVKRFHSWDCVHGDKEFERWRFADRLALYGELATLVTKYDILGMSSAVLPESFSRLPQWAQKKFVGSRNLAFEHFLQQSVSWCRKRYGSKEQIGVIADTEGPQIAEAALEVFRRYETSEMWGDALAGMGHASSLKFTPLQAADLLAYATYRYLMEKHYPEDELPYFPVLTVFDRILPDIAAKGGYFDDGALQGVMRRVIEREGEPKPEDGEMKAEATEFEKFDATVGKLLSVSHKELQKREKRYQKQRAKKKRAKP